ncbi:MAG: hypothetical protein U9O24_00465 [Campylobacterota bacterium]|nr:hypothetical protein [Campylobacterota bacterium]
MPNNSPTFVMEKNKLNDNLLYFERLAQKTGIIWLYTVKAFHEQKGLSCIAKRLKGFSIGSLNEFENVKEQPYKNLHSYAPAYYEDEVETLAQISTTLSFNSLTQWQRYADKCKQTSLGLRINPMLSLKQPEYCDTNKSRLGVDYRVFLEMYPTLTKLEGLHFHALCHQDVSAFLKLIEHLRTHYHNILPKLKWLNLGGGQNFTHADYDTVLFTTCINSFKSDYPNLTIYLEPGSSVVHKTGYFECTVLDIIDDIVILNTSIETHLLDIAITKQIPNVRNTSREKTPYKYTLTGTSCLAGDEIATYYFNKTLKIGDKVFFENMIGYTLVKQTEFNGIKKAKFLLI